MWLSYEYAADPAQHLGPEERAQAKLWYTRRHLALVRACMDIDAFLKGHGVMGMIRGEGATSSVNSALVAVLGLAVKKQDVGYGLFTTTSGHAHLKREFTRYFELSPDMAALERDTATAADAVAAAEQALAAWDRLEAGR